MMAMQRARWIIMVAVLAGTFGLARQHAFVVRLSVACLVWLGLEWIIFQYRVDVFLRRCRTTRDIRYRDRSSRCLWEMRAANVQTKLVSPSGQGWLPSVVATVHDLAPSGVEVLGDHGRSFQLGSESEISLNYQIVPLAPGSVQFSGIRFVLHDLHGFFQAERYLPLVQRFRVLPFAIDAGARSTIRKQANVLPPPGMHLMPRAGVGSELLEIRDYLPGDPPRSIAWKISARRDELMCKQFESEVPVRCQLFLDMSPGVRLGHPGVSLGGRLASLAATIATTLGAHRDPVGLCLFGGPEVHIQAASANRKSIVHMIDRMCRKLDEPVVALGAPPRQLIRSAIDIARIRYPIATQYAMRVFAGLLPRSRVRERVQIAAVLANHYGLNEFDMRQLVDCDETLSYWLQRFHTDHGAPYTGGLFDTEGRPLFDDSSKLDQLTTLLRRAAARGRDDELFVIMAQLTDDEYDLRSFVQAVKFARARRHHIVVVLAWPSGIPAPEAPISFDRLLDESTVSMADRVQLRLAEKQFDRLSAELAKLKVPVTTTADGNTVPLILKQLQIISAGRISA